MEKALRKYLLLLCCTYSGAFAQNPTALDSLKNAFIVAATPETKSTTAYQIADRYRKDKADSARKYIDFALDFAQKAQKPALQAKAYYIDALLLRDAVAFERSIESSQKALSLYESVGDKKGVGKTYSALGLTYKKMGDAQKVVALTQKALEFGLKAVETLESANDTVGLITAYNNLGITHRDLKEFDKAEMAYKNGLIAAQKAGIMDGVLHANLGQIYSDYRKNYDAAIQELQKALAIHEKAGNQKGIEHCYRTLSDVYQHKKEYEKAVFYGEKSVEIAKTLNDAHRSFNAYKVLSAAQEGAGQYQKALESVKMWKILEDSTVRADKTKSIADMATKYETEKKEIVITQLNEKNKLQRAQLIGAILGLGLLAGLLGLLYRQNKKIKASQLQISEQSEQLKLMMKELHHRVKNNLAIVSSLLKIQSSKLEDEKAVQAVRQGQQRVEAMSLIHQRLYQTDKISHINIKEYINDLVESLMHAYGYAPDNFDLALTVEQEFLDVDTAMPIGLILNELLTNSFKYAFENSEKPALTIALKMDKSLTLDVQDNGIGIDLDRWQKAKGSFGKKLITGLSKQIGGQFTMENDNGAKFRLVIPLEKLKLAA
jgi:two-component sensor histidine kinase